MSNLNDDILIDSEETYYLIKDLMKQIKGEYPLEILLFNAADRLGIPHQLAEEIYAIYSIRDLD